MWDFELGQQVVCIDDEGFSFRSNEKCPIKDGIYTIRDLMVDDEGELILRLFEIVNQPMLYDNEFTECWFIASRFRPVRKTDISVFKALLNKIPTEREIEDVNHIFKVKEDV